MFPNAPNEVCLFYVKNFAKDLFNKLYSMPICPVRQSFVSSQNHQNDNFKTIN